MQRHQLKEWQTAIWKRDETGGKNLTAWSLSRTLLPQQNGGGEALITPGKYDPKGYLPQESYFA